MSVILWTVGVLLCIFLALILTYHLMRFAAMGWFSGKVRVVRRKGVRRTYDNDR